MKDFKKIDNIIYIILVIILPLAISNANIYNFSKLENKWNSISSLRNFELSNTKINNFNAPDDRNLILSITDSNLRIIISDSSWTDTRFEYRTNITRNPYNIKENVTNFPLLFEIYRERLGNYVQESSNDIMFTDNDCNKY